MGKSAFYTDPKFLVVALSVLSFIPVELSCAPGNFLLVLSPFIYLAVRFVANKEFVKDDFVAVGIFALLIIFVTIVSYLAGCVNTYGVPREPLAAWKQVSIDGIGPGGVIYVGNLRNTEIATTDIFFYIDGAQSECVWEPSVRYIAPGDVKKCTAAFACTGQTRIDLVSPGNNDSVTC